MTKYGVISGPNTGKYGSEITLYLDTFHAVINVGIDSFFLYLHWYLKKDAVRVTFGTRTQTTI